MKKEINPIAATIAIVLFACLAGFFIYLRSGGFGPEEATMQSNPMPKEAAEFMAKAMSRTVKNPKYSHPTEATADSTTGKAAPGKSGGNP